MFVWHGGATVSVQNTIIYDLFASRRTANEPAHEISVVDEMITMLAPPFTFLLLLRTGLCFVSKYCYTRLQTHHGATPSNPDETNVDDRETDEFYNNMDARFSSPDIVPVPKPAMFSLTNSRHWQSLNKAITAGVFIAGIGAGMLVTTSHA